MSDYCESAYETLLNRHLANPKPIPLSKHESIVQFCSEWRTAVELREHFGKINIYYYVTKLEAEGRVERVVLARGSDGRRRWKVRRR